MVAVTGKRGTSWTPLQAVIVLRSPTFLVKRGRSWQPLAAVPATKASTFCFTALFFAFSPVLLGTLGDVPPPRLLCAAVMKSLPFFKNSALVIRVRMADRNLDDSRAILQMNVGLAQRNTIKFLIKKSM